MKTYGVTEVQIHLFLISVLDGGDWSASAPTEIPPGKEPSGTHGVGGWGVLQSQPGPYGEETNLLPLLEMEPQCLGRLARRLVAIQSELSCLSETGKLKASLSQTVEFKEFFIPTVNKGRWPVSRFGHVNLPQSILRRVGSS
jgi:hypothetical protein